MPPPALAKRKMADEWFQRIRQVFINAHLSARKQKKRTKGLFIAKGADQLEKEFEDISWLGVVFSDGNGLGQIMLKFKDWLDNDDDYLNTLRNFSIEMDAATEAAFYAACQKLEKLGAAQEMKRKGKRLPVVPLLLGGDDLTVLVDGRFALPFTQAFLEAFEIETAKEKSPTIAKIAQKALGAGRLSAGAGVAIVKKHFPFHSAYGLADSLLKSAKITKKKVQQKGKTDPYPCSSLDFHILFDAAYSGLNDIRVSRRTGPNGERLWGGPYVVTPEDSLKDAESTKWATKHHISVLRKQVAALNDCDSDGRLKLPSSQTHALREALAQGKTVADARLAEMRWLDQAGLEQLFDGENSLFEGEGKMATTRFLDALSSAEFWPKEKQPKSQEAGK